MINYTQIVWEEVAFSWKVIGKAEWLLAGKAVAIFITPTVFDTDLI